MITVIVDTEHEYDETMEYAKKYVCTRRTFSECAEYPPHSCDKCYKDNHIIAGIRIVPPVDTPVLNKL